MILSNFVALKRQFMTQQHRPIDDTRRLIVEAILAANQPLTRTQIARALHRSKTPHLNNVIDTLVEEGYLMRSVTTFRNGVEGYIYDLSPSFRDTLS
jgi:predicted transcriptional regulator